MLTTSIHIIKTPNEAKGDKKSRDRASNPKPIGTYDESGIDFLCEMPANQRADFLNLAFWVQTEFSADRVSAEQKLKVLGAI